MGNPDKIVAVGLGEVLYDHDVVTDEYTFGGAPANFADHFLKCSRLISGPDGFAASGSCLPASSTNAGMPPGSTPTRFCPAHGMQ